MTSLTEVESECNNTNLEINIIHSQKEYISGQLSDVEQDLTKQMLNSINAQLFALREQVNEKEAELVRNSTVYGSNHEAVLKTNENLIHLKSQLKGKTNELIAAGLSIVDPLEYRQELISNLLQMETELNLLGSKSFEYQVLIKKYENAGVAAVSIEDKVFPKQNSLLKNGKQDLLSEKDFVAKIIAAKNAKKNPSFMVIARVEALIAGLGIDEALKRATAYEEAGADAILIHSKQNTPDELFDFCDKWNGKVPIVSIPTSYPSVTLNELQNHKVKMVIYANQSLRKAHWAMENYLQKLSKVQSLSEIDSEMSTMENIFHLQEMYTIKNRELEIEDALKKMGYINE